jgi:hypothetical protein
VLERLQELVLRGIVDPAHHPADPQQMHREERQVEE